MSKEVDIKVQKGSYAPKKSEYNGKYFIVN